MDPPGFNTHSFKIGATASAKQVSNSDSYLKFLGKWKNNAYLGYIILLSADLAMLSKTLISTSQ